MPCMPRGANVWFGLVVETAPKGSVWFDSRQVTLVAQRKSSLEKDPQVRLLSIAPVERLERLKKRRSKDHPPNAG